MDFVSSCGEKFVPGHKCTTPPDGVPAAQLALILADIGDGGGILSDEVLGALEEHALATEADCHVSLHAISGTQGNKAIHLRALVNNQVLSVLVDSGSSYTFINSAIISKLRLYPTIAEKLQVQVANGHKVISDKQVKDFEWWIQGHTFKVDAKVLDLAAYDLILGMDWLEEYSPMTCDWLAKWIEFDYHGSWVKFQGIMAHTTTQLAEISREQLYKWYKGNDIWAMVILSPVPKDDPLLEQYIVNGIPAPVQQAIHDHADLFQPINELPPNRVFDHAISLLPDSVPVNCRPYRYSPQQKDEIEKQVATMLRAGTVIPSLSPFASPVLLVKKKDGTWRFCGLQETQCNYYQK